MSDTDIKTGDGGAAKRKNTAIRAGILVAVLVLIVLGIEAFRQYQKSSSAGSVANAFEDSIDFLGRPNDWQAHFETRRGKADGAPQMRVWAAKYGEQGHAQNDKLTEWLQALLGCGTGKAMPTEAELTTLRASCPGIEADAKALLAFKYLDGVPNFLPNGEVSADMDYFYALRKLQLFAAAALHAGSRDEAMTGLELVLDLTNRRQAPFGLFDLLLMSVLEPYTHVLAGRLAESGPLSARSIELLTSLEAAPSSSLTVVEGELAMGAWRYQVVGIEAMAVDGQSGWFAWGSFSGGSETNDITAENQRGLLELCEIYKQGRQPSPTSELGIGLKRNMDQGFATLKAQRTRSMHVVKVRQALAGGTDPGASVSTAADAGIKIEHTADGWRVAFVGDAAQRTAMQHGDEAEFATWFPAFVLK